MGKSLSRCLMSKNSPKNQITSRSAEILDGFAICELCQVHDTFNTHLQLIFVQTKKQTLPFGQKEPTRPPLGSHARNDASKRTKDHPYLSLQTPLKNRVHLLPPLKDEAPVPMSHKNWGSCFISTYAERFHEPRQPPLPQWAAIMRGWLPPKRRQ
jgi:hypothetical protein